MDLSAMFNMVFMVSTISSEVNSWMHRAGTYLSNFHSCYNRRVASIGIHKAGRERGKSTSSSVRQHDSERICWLCQYYRLSCKWISSIDDIHLHCVGSMFLNIEPTLFIFWAHLRYTKVNTPPHSAPGLWRHVCNQARHPARERLKISTAVDQCG